MLQLPQASACTLAMLLVPLPGWARVQTTIVPTLPNLTTGETSADDPDVTYCRPPQHQTDSRLMAPKACMTNRQ
jgi:hypothetical protein